MYSYSRFFFYIFEPLCSTYYLYRTIWYSEYTFTVTRFVWDSAKIGTCTVVSVNVTLAEAKMCTFTLESTHFIFKKCPIYTHDGASDKFKTNSQETDDSVLCTSHRCWFTYRLTTGLATYLDMHNDNRIPIFFLHPSVSIADTRTAQIMQICRSFYDNYHKVLTYVEYRSVSGDFQNILTPHPPSLPSECVLPRTTHSPDGEGVGGQYFGRHQTLDWPLTV